jgi:hypothetical protein
MGSSVYDMTLNDRFMGNMHIILEHMRSLSLFSGPLANADQAAEEVVLYDFSLLPD